MPLNEKFKILAEKYWQKELAKEEPEVLMYGAGEEFVKPEPVSKVDEIIDKTEHGYIEDAVLGYRKLKEKEEVEKLKYENPLLHTQIDNIYEKEGLDFLKRWLEEKNKTKEPRAVHPKAAMAEIFPEPEIRPEGELTTKLTFMDKLREYRDQPVTKILKLFPFVSGAVEWKEMADLAAAAYRFQENEKNNKPQDPKDLLLLKEYLDKARADRDFFYNVIDIVEQMPAFMGEILLTSPLYRIFKEGAEKTAVKTLKKLLKKEGREILENKLAKLGIKSVAGVIGGTIQAPFAAATRIGAETVREMMPEFDISEDEAGELVGTLIGGGQDFLPALSKAFRRQWVEVVSERSGGMFPLLGSVGQDIAMKTGIMRAFLKANPKKTITEFQQLVRRAGWNGILNEILEERVAEVGHWAVTEEEYRVPTPEQLLTELVAFSIPGTAIMIADNKIGVPADEKKQLLEAMKRKGLTRELTREMIGAKRAKVRRREEQEKIREERRKRKEELVEGMYEEEVPVEEMSIEQQIEEMSKLGYPEEEIPYYSGEERRRVIERQIEYTGERRKPKEEITPEEKKEEIKEEELTKEKPREEEIEVEEEVPKIEGLKEGDEFTYRGVKYRIEEIGETQIVLSDVSTPFPSKRKFGIDRVKKMIQETTKEKEPEIEEIGEVLEEIPQKKKKQKITRVRLEGKTPQEQIANILMDYYLEKDKEVTWRDLKRIADEYFGGTMAEGKYSIADAYDALELMLNSKIDASAIDINAETDEAIENIKILKNTLEKLPTQTKRTEEKELYDQYSTPPPLAYVVNWLGNIRENDVVLEPSAGTGNIAVFAKGYADKVDVNEIDEKRRKILESLEFDKITNVDAEHLDTRLPKEIKPTVILMNPPFVHAERMKGKRIKDLALRHVEEALKRLENGGRLVAIIGGGMSINAPAYKNAWERIFNKGIVRANVKISGKEYRKFGTAFDNRIIVIDKVGKTTDELRNKIIEGNVKKVEDLINLLEEVRNERKFKGKRPPGEPTGEETPKEGGTPTKPGGVIPSATPESGAVEGERGERGRKLGTRGGVTGIPTEGSVGAVTGGITSTEEGQEPTGKRVESGRGGRESESTRKIGSLDDILDDTFDDIDKVFGLELHPLELAREYYEPPIPGFKQEIYDKLKPVLDKSWNKYKEAGGKIASFKKSIIDRYGDKVLPYLTKWVDEIKPEEETKEKPVKEEKPPKSKEEADVIYVPYKINQDTGKAKKHPAILEESVAMSAVKSPRVKYIPKLNKGVIENGRLSAEQLEVVMLTGHAQNQILPSGKRQGFFCGDGTGVGKGREIAAIIQDNFNRGRKKAVWITNNFNLYKDAMRDLGLLKDDKGNLTGIQWKDIVLRKQNEWSIDSEIDDFNGVLFTAYPTLAKRKESEDKTKVIASRLQQLIDWLGKDFDGVIIFDECHNMGNLIQDEETRRQPSDKAIAGSDLQNALPNARICYFSATGATDVRNLAYLERLGLWGKGKPYTKVEDFVNAVSKEIAAMEVVARDLKAMGLYISRNLSYRDVEYKTVTHKLNDKQITQYNEVANIWQAIMRGMNEWAEELNTDKIQMKNIRAQFYGSLIRFYNIYMSSLSIPTLIKNIKKDLEEDKSILIQLVNTGGEATERAFARSREFNIDLDDLTINPEEELLRFLRVYFPIHKYEKYIDKYGKERVRPVINPDTGEHEIDPEAERKRDELIERISGKWEKDKTTGKLIQVMPGIRIPQNPIDQLLEFFGDDVIAEITGRNRRLYKNEEQNRSDLIRNKEVKEFLDGKRRILIFSQKGGVGESYHAGLEYKNQQRRSHYVLQPGWRADIALQGMGRSHRTNQASAPIYTLVTTDIAAHQRFMATIARRLDQTGALTKGQRETGSQGLFSSEANYESKYGKDALNWLFRDIYYGNVEGIDVDFVKNYMDIEYIDDYGRINESKMPNVKRFLNRIMMLQLDDMNILFTEFDKRFKATIADAIEKGIYDAGIESIKIVDFKILREVSIRIDPATGTETKYAELEIEKEKEFVPFKFIKETNVAGFARNKQSKRVWAYHKPRNVTNQLTGAVTQRMVIQNTIGHKDIIDYDKEDFEKRFEYIPDDQAEKAWNDDIKSQSPTHKLKRHIIVGALLPVWRHLPEKFKVQRFKAPERIKEMFIDKVMGTVKGIWHKPAESIIGAVISEKDVNWTLRRMGIQSEQIKRKMPSKLIPYILNKNRKITFSNDWVVHKSIVAGDERIEIKNIDVWDYYDYKEEGLFQEKIASKVRYFIPTNEIGEKILQKIKSNYDILEDEYYAGKKVEPLALKRPKKEKAETKPKNISETDWGVIVSREERTKKRINKTKVYRYIKKEFGVDIRGKVTERMGAAAGKYYPQEVLIRIKKWGELPVICHEVAHHIDFGILRKKLGEEWYKQDVPEGIDVQKMIAELRNLDYSKKLRRIPEGFAEFMKYLLTTDEASEKAPNFYAFFTNIILGEKAPSLDKKLLKLKELMITWQLMGSMARMEAQIDWRGEHTKPQGVKAKWWRFKKWFHKNWNDKFYVIEVKTKQIEKLINRELPPTENPYKMVEFSKKKAGGIAYWFVHKAAISPLHDKVGEPLIKILAPIKAEDMRNFIIYAASRRVIWLAEERKLETGFDLEDAKYVVKLLENKEWDDVADKITEWSNTLIDWLVWAGGLSKDEAKLIRTLNPIYLPFTRAFMEEVEPYRIPAGRFANLGKPVKTYRGSARPIINPMESLVSQLTRLISQAYRIRIGYLFAKLSFEHGIGGIIKEVPPQRFPYYFELKNIKDLKDLRKLLDEMGFDTDVLDLEKIVTVWLPSYQYFGKDNVLSLFINGKRRFFELDQELHDALRFLDPKSLNIFEKVMGALKRMIRLGATSLKPSFWLAKNPFRDTYTYVTYSKSKKAMIWDWFAGIYKYFDAKPGTSAWKFMAGAGWASGFIGQDRAAAMTTYDDLLYEKLKPYGKILKIIKHPIYGFHKLIDSFRGVSIAGETSLRLKEVENMYKEYKKKKPNWTDDDCYVQAFLDGQEVNIDFSRAGVMSERVDNITAFFNAFLRDIDRVYTVFKERPLLTTVRGIAWLTTLAMLMWWRNRDKQWYKNLPLSYKYNNIFIDMPGTDTIVRLPIPFNLGIIFCSMPIAALDALYYKNTESVKYLEGLMKTIEMNLSYPIPNLVQLAIDVKANKNWLGVPIESEGMKYLYPTERKRDYTSKMAIVLSKAFDKIGVRISPLKLDYIFNQSTGGLYRQIQPKKELLETADIPVIGDVILRSPLYPRRQLNEFYSDYEYLGQRKRSGIINKEDLRKYMRIKGLYPKLNRIYKQIKKYREEKDKEKLNALYTKMTKYLEAYGYK